MDYAESSRMGGNQEPAIGIDLGTTYSCVAVWQHDHIEVIANDQGNRTTPSWVAFTEQERLIGEAAKNQVAVNAENTVSEVKRLIGRQFSETSVQDDMKCWPFKVIAGHSVDKTKPMINVTYKGKERCFAPEEISAMVLTKMKNIAENFLGRTIKNAVITVPAYFNGSQRQATRDAGTLAGLNVLRIINEPTAAAMAYRLDHKDGNDKVTSKNVLIFDLGGGTFDVSIVNFKKDIFDVKAVCGNTHLGGGDFDRRMVNHFKEEFKRKFDKDISGNPRACAKLKTACENAKTFLSGNVSTNISIDCLYGPIDFISTITRAQFEKMNMDLFEACLEPVKMCLQDAKMQKSDIHDIVLVGGSTRIPKIQQMLQDFFGGRNLSKCINPDEAIAVGAAHLAAILSGVGNNQTCVVSDVTAFSLGIEAANGNMEVIIPRNTPIPTYKERMFSTAFAKQTEVSIPVYEGEARRACLNHYLAMFKLSGIPQAGRGVPRIKNCFQINADGILSCSAVDERTGNGARISITRHNERLPADEMTRMMMVAQLHMSEDQQFKTKIEGQNSLEQAKNSLEYYCKCVSRILSNHASKLQQEDREKMEHAVNRTTEWLNWNSELTLSSSFEIKKIELEMICWPIIAKMNL